MEITRRCAVLVVKGNGTFLANDITAAEAVILRQDGYRQVEGLRESFDAL